jgi:hypothetical protein
MNTCWYCLEIIPKSASLWIIADVNAPPLGGESLSLLACEPCYIEYLERRSLNEHIMRYGK